MSVFRRHNNQTEQENINSVTDGATMVQGRLDADPTNDPILPHHRSAGMEEKAMVKSNTKEHRRCHPFRAVKIAMQSSSRLSGSVNFLIPFIPVGIVLGFARKDLGLYIFAFNFIAMIPSANMLAFASQEIALKMPKTYGAVFETFMGAVVELIVLLLLQFQQPRERHIPVVRDAIIGSMLANLLLVTGLCFIAGGIREHHQELAEHVTEVTGAGLLVAAVGLIIPALFYQAATLFLGQTQTELQISHEVLQVTRLVAIGLLVSYFLLLFFQLKTHHSVFHEALEAAEAKDRDAHLDELRDKASLLEAVILLIFALTCVCFCAYFMIHEIEFVIERGHISEAFLGLILIPVVEKAAEHLIAIDDAWDGSMDIALQHCLGATIQTALLVAPVVVIAGWGANNAMDLNFNYIWAFLLVLSVLVVGNFVRDGKSNWLEGSYLIMVYYAIAVAAWYFPRSPEIAGEGENGSNEGTSGTEGEGHSTMTEAAVAAATSVAVEAVKRLLF